MHRFSLVVSIRKAGRFRRMQPQRLVDAPWRFQTFWRRIVVLEAMAWRCRLVASLPLYEVCHRISSWFVKFKDILKLRCWWLAHGTQWNSMQDCVLARFLPISFCSKADWHPCILAAKKTLRQRIHGLLEAMVCHACRWCCFPELIKTFRPFGPFLRRRRPRDSTLNLWLDRECSPLDLSEVQQEQALEEKFNTMQHLYSPRFVNRKTGRFRTSWHGCKMQLLFDSGWMAWPSRSFRGWDRVDSKASPHAV